MPSEYEDERELDDYNPEDCDCDAYWKLQCRVHTTRREAQRKARPFSSKEIGRQSRRLSELLSDFYGRTIIANIENALPIQVSINL